MKTLAQYVHEELHGILDFQALSYAIWTAQKRMEEDRAQEAVSHAEAATAEAVARNVSSQRLTPSFIVTQVASWVTFIEQTPVTPEEIMGRGKQAEVVRARQLAMYVLKELRSDLSSLQVGAFFDRDHSTVLHAIKQVQHEDHEDLLGYVRAQFVNATGKDARR